MTVTITLALTDAFADALSRPLPDDQTINELLAEVQRALPRKLMIGDRVKSAPHGTFPLQEAGVPWEIIAIADGHALLRAHVPGKFSSREPVYQHAALCVLERVDA